MALLLLVLLLMAVTLAASLPLAIVLPIAPRLSDLPPLLLLLLLLLPPPPPPLRLATLAGPRLRRRLRRIPPAALGLLLLPLLLLPAAMGLPLLPLPPTPLELAVIPLARLAQSVSAPPAAALAAAAPAGGIATWRAAASSRGAGASNTAGDSSLLLLRRMAATTARRFAPGMWQAAGDGQCVGAAPAAVLLRRQMLMILRNELFLSKRRGQTAARAPEACPRNAQFVAISVCGLGRRSGNDYLNPTSPLTPLEPSASCDAMHISLRTVPSSACFHLRRHHHTPSLATHTPTQFIKHNDPQMMCVTESPWAAS